MTNIYRVAVTSDKDPDNVQYFVVAASSVGTAIGRGIRGEVHNQATEVHVSCFLLHRNMTIEAYKALQASQEE